MRTGRQPRVVRKDTPSWTLCAEERKVCRLCNEEDAGARVLRRMTAVRLSVAKSRGMPDHRDWYGGGTGPHASKQ